MWFPIFFVYIRHKVIKIHLRFHFVIPEVFIETPVFMKHICIRILDDSLTDIGNDNY